MGGVNSKVHAKRLAQASEVLIELQGDSTQACIAHMSICKYIRLCRVASPLERSSQQQCCVGGGATKGDEALTHMQLDGEPWPQTIPTGKGGTPVLVRYRSLLGRACATSSASQC